MWHVENPELRCATFDFTSSEQGYREVTQLFSDGVQLINAIELIDWDSGDAQFLICSSCGTTGCEPGGWVSLRRSGSLVVILPSADHIWAERDEDKREYAPPAYLLRNGIAYFDRSTYESLTSQHSDLPSFEQFRQLNKSEAVLIFHWEAPARVLGAPPVIELRRDLIIGSAEGDCDEHLNRVQHLLNEQYNDDSDSLLRPLSSVDQPISIYIDATEFIDWKPLVFDGAEYRLVVDSRFVIVSDDYSKKS